MILASSRYVFLLSVNHVLTLIFYSQAVILVTNSESIVWISLRLFLIIHV